MVSAQEQQPSFTVQPNPEYLGFEKVEVTEVDDSKPWKPALKVRVTKEDGSVVEDLDASTPFFTFKDAEGDEMTVSAEAAGHIDSLHIRGEDPGSKFDYGSLDALFSDAAAKIPKEAAKEGGPYAFSVDMGKSMGKEGIASMKELLESGVIEQSDIDAARAEKDTVFDLNREGDATAKDAFIAKFRAEHPDSKVQFQLVRGTVLVPTVETPKRDTTELFMVFGPGADTRKTLYTAAPGRNMPRHPNPAQHTDAEGKLNEATFNESAEAWFNTVMLTGGE